MFAALAPMATAELRMVTRLDFRAESDGSCTSMTIVGTFARARGATERSVSGMDRMKPSKRSRRASAMRASVSSRAVRTSVQSQSCESPR